MGRQPMHPMLPHRRRRPAAAAALVALCCLAALPAAASDDGGVSGAFLRFGSSARSLGLGGAVTALGDGAAVAYWNPAGLSQLRTMEVTGMGATLFADTKYSFFAIGLPREGSGTFAFSGSYVNSGSFERASLWDDLGDTFSESEGVFTLSYARGGSHFGWGVSFKSITQDVGGVTGSGVGADVGLYLRPERRVSLGVAWQNALQPEVTLDDYPEKLARTLRGGFALHFYNDRLIALTDIVKTDDMDLNVQGGVEWRPLESIVLRGGYDTTADQFTFGGGVAYRNWQFDYAYLSHDLGAVSVVSATLRFGIVDGVEIVGDRLRFSPAGNDRKVNFSIATALRGRIADWQLDILDEDGRLVRTLGDDGPPPAELSWGGEDANGRLVGDGEYTARMLLHDDLGQRWESETKVQIVGFRNGARAPIRIDISGSHKPDSKKKDER